MRNYYLLSSIIHRDFWVFSTPSSLCGQTWSLDKPPLKNHVDFHATPPLFQKYWNVFGIFESKALHKFDTSIEIFVLDLLIPNCLIFTLIYINLGLQKSTWISTWDPPPPCGFTWIFVEPPLVIHMVYGCSLVSIRSRKCKVFRVIWFVLSTNRKITWVWKGNKHFINNK